MKVPLRVSSNFYSALASIALLVFVGIACNMQSDDDWKNALANKKLSRASNAGSFSDKTTFYFCPSGEYAMQTQSSGFSTGGAGTLSTASEDAELGRWDVDSGTLTLHPQNGESRQYGLSQGSDSNVIVLDGRGYLVESQDDCQ